MEEKLHRRWVKIGGKKGSIFKGNFQVLIFFAFPNGFPMKNISLPLQLGEYKYHHDNKILK